MKTKIKVTDPKYLPKYTTEQSAGADLRARLEGSYDLFPRTRITIPTGVFIQLTPGEEAQIRPRSGMAAKHGITVLNAPGTIDADYRGEIGVILYNASEDIYTVKDGDRIAQMVIAEYKRKDWDLVDELDDTERGTGGFGHTGKN